MLQELRLSEFNHRLSRISTARKQDLTWKGDTKQEIHIVYVVTHMALNGGVKMILEHANRLQKAGAKTSIVTHYPKPSWYEIHSDYIQVPFTIELAKGIPYCDVIVATYWDHIQACVETGIAPVVYFEQGDFHLFDYDSMNATLKKFINVQFELPEYIFTVSAHARDKMKTIYGREAHVIHNAVDKSIFHMGGEKYEHHKPYLLMIGGEASTFKGLNEIILAYEIVKETNQDLELFWITQYEPSAAMKQKVSKCFVSPSQQMISNLYRGAALYVSASHYESFSLPPLEAMACGCPVVTTHNSGVLEYATHEKNCLTCNIKDTVDLTNKIQRLLTDESLRQSLIEQGEITAKQFDWDTIIENLLAYYLQIAKHRVKHFQELSEWEITVTQDDFHSHDEYQQFVSLLHVTPASLIQIPIVYELEALPVVARWEIVASKKNSPVDQIEQCYTPIKARNKFALITQPAMQSLFIRNYDQALEELEASLANVTDTLQKAVLNKWIIFTLIRLQRKFEAREKLAELLIAHPYFSDFHYLQWLVSDSEQEKARSREKVMLLGDAASHPEFFFQLQESVWK